MLLRAPDYLRDAGATETPTVATAWPFAVTTVMAAVSEPFERTKSRTSVPAAAIADDALDDALAFGTAVKPWAVRVLV